MSLVGRVERLLINIEADISPEYVFLHVNKEVALERLKELTGQDFEYDGRRWRTWLTENGFVEKKSPSNWPAAIADVRSRLRGS